MECHQNIDHDKFPKQGPWLNQRVRVTFNYSDEFRLGTIVRDDREGPCVIIIRLDDGRFVLDTECQYALATAEQHLKSEASQ